jgi:SAM-dependent MidA family methyltransferase
VPVAPQPWSRAWSRAARAFYADAVPADHFRTSAHVGSSLARPLAALLAEVDDRLGHPDVLDVVDVGAGDGRMLEALLDAVPADLARRLRPVAVDLRSRPSSLDPRVGWVQGLAGDAVPAGVRGLLLAHELLDDVPCDVVEVDDDGRVRLVLVDDAGEESPGPALDDDAGRASLGADAAAARAWLSAWWPLHAPGDRADIGLGRDALWRSLVDRVDAGTALAVDYGHVRDGRPQLGSMAAYAEGRQVEPVPDGRRNLTAHVAVDALAYASGAVLERQRDALRSLGVRATAPPRDLAATDPVAYLDALARSGEDAELLDPSGLGSHWWVRSDVG